MMKKALNISFLKFQQSTVNVRFFNVYVLSFNTCSSEILNLKKKIEEKNLIFMKINAV